MLTRLHHTLLFSTSSMFTKESCRSDSSSIWLEIPVRLAHPALVHLVRWVGLEPTTRLCGRRSQRRAYANSATSA
jgi:hypothetical protein